MTTSGIPRTRRPLRRILDDCGGYVGWVLVTGVLQFVSLGAGIGLIATSAYLISRSALVDSTAPLALTIVGVRFFAVVRVVSRYTERYVGHLGTFRTLTRLRVWVFRGILPGAPASMIDRRSGDVLTNVVDDVDTLQDLFLRVLVPPFAGAMAVALGCAVLGRFDPWLGLALLGYVLLCGVVLPLATRRMSRRPAAALVDVQAELAAATVEGVAGISDLVAFDRADLLIARLDRLTHAQVAARKKLARARGLAAGFTALLVGLASLTLLILGIVLVDGGDIEPVMLALLPLVAIATFEAVGPVTLSFENLERCRAAGRRLITTIDAPPAVADPPAAFGTVRVGAPMDLEVTNLAFGYEPHRPVLSGATFLIPAGSVVALTGPSGSGKSTIASLLLRFWDYPQGSIRLGGVELRDLPLDEARSLVAVVAQHDHLFDTTLRDNLSLADEDADDERLWAACDDAGIGATIRRLPLGLDERVGADASRLSGGERQRVLVARALLTDAPVLVLDEATAHLDTETAKRVLETVLHRREGLTTIVVTHDEDQVGAVDLLLRADAGLITAIEPGAASEGRPATPSR